MKHVLIIGMDQTAGDIVSRVLKDYDDFFQVYRTENDDHAIEISSRIRPDLLIVDLSRPETNDLKLLHQIKKAFPDLPGIAILNLDHPVHEIKIEYPGITEYIGTPIQTDQLTEAILKILNITVSGQIHGISLSSFLQMVEMEEKTCYLRVREHKKTGYLYFNKGELIAAETGSLENEEAAYEIIGWEDAAIEIYDAEKNMEKKIHSPLMNILIETLKRKDEKTSRKQEKKQERKSTPDSGIKREADSDLRFGLEMGTRLHVKPENLAVTIKSTFVGMKPEEFLIISTPESLEALSATPAADQQVVVKYLFNGIIFAFKSRILKTIPAPFHLLFLAYPQKVERRYIRSLKRIQCFIPAKAVCNQEEIIGSILDINIRGCGCLLQALDRHDLLAWGVNDPISLLCRFPGIEGEIQITGLIKNIRVTNEGTVVGVAFYEKIHPDIQDIINQYIVSVGELD